MILCKLHDFANKLCNYVYQCNDYRYNNINIIRKEAVVLKI